MTSLLLQIATEPASPGAAMDFTWLFLKMLLVLGMVCVLAVLFLKYIVPHLQKSHGHKQAKLFRIHSRFSLEPKRHLYIVEISKRYFVIGASESGIQLVTELSRADVEGSAS